jgi:hypothetical protein
MSNKFDTVLTYYKNEVNLKNNEINNLKSIINNLKAENKKLFNKIELLKFENFKVKELYGTKENFQNLKINLNNNNNNNNENFNENFYTKKEIYDLEIFNRKNVELITKMTNFYNKINNLFNNNNIILKYDGIKTNIENFNKNMNIIETEIMFQYGDGKNFPQNNFPYNNNNNNFNNNNNNFNINNNFNNNNNNNFNNFNNENFNLNYDNNNNNNFNREKLFKPFNIKNYI